MSDSSAESARRADDTAGPEQTAKEGNGCHSGDAEVSGGLVAAWERLRVGVVDLGGVGVDAVRTGRPFQHCRRRIGFEGGRRVERVAGLGTGPTGSAHRWRSRLGGGWSLVSGVGRRGGRSTTVSAQRRRLGDVGLVRGCWAFGVLWRVGVGAA